MRAPQKTRAGKRPPKRSRRSRVKKAQGASVPRNGSPQFRASYSFQQLARMQGVQPLADPGILQGGWPNDQNVNEFLEETYQERS